MVWEAGRRPPAPSPPHPGCHHTALSSGLKNPRYSQTAKLLLYSYLSIRLEVVVEYVNTDGQVTSVKRIGPVPSLRTKLTTLSNTRVEITQREQNALEFILTGTHLQRVLTRKKLRR